MFLWGSGYTSAQQYLFYSPRQTGTLSQTKTEPLQQTQNASHCDNGHIMQLTQDLCEAKWCFFPSHHLIWSNVLQSGLSLSFLTNLFTEGWKHKPNDCLIFKEEKRYAHCSLIWRDSLGKAALWKKHHLISSLTLALICGECVFSHVSCPGLCHKIRSAIYLWQCLQSLISHTCDNKRKCCWGVWEERGTCSNLSDLVAGLYLGL